jgi:hypothetical protein
VASAGNPKAIVFFAALFPQFMVPSAEVLPVAVEFLILGVLFLTIDGLSVFLYAATAGRLSAWLSQQGRITAQRRFTIHPAVPGYRSRTELVASSRRLRTWSRGSATWLLLTHHTGGYTTRSLITLAIGVFVITVRSP